MMRSLHRLIFVWLICSSACAAGGDWPQFRGPDGQGHATVTACPLRWSETEHVVWKVPIEGRGWSSPVVAGDQIWLTTALDTAAAPDVAQAAVARIGPGASSPQVASRLTLKAVCVDRHSGRVVRAVTVFEITEPAVICSVNSFASPTPVLDAGRVYCDFGAWGTACVEADTGAVVWRRQLVIEHAVGPGSSPVVHGNLLILVRDGCDEQYVTALDKDTGQTVWRTARPPLATPSAVMRKSFSTPLAFEADGRPQLVAIGAQWVAAYEPASGRELWRVDTGRTFSNIARPAYGCGLVFACTAYGGSVLSAIRPDGQGDVTATHVVWQQQRSVPKRSSPLVAGDELYLLSDQGIASCLDARTGAVHWSERLAGACSASPVHAAGRLYFFAEDGATVVVRPGRTFERLAENRLDGRVLASPAFVDRAILVRTDTHLYRLEESR